MTVDKPRPRYLGIILVLTAILIAGLPFSTNAQTRSELGAKVLKCKPIKQDANRLECFDQSIQEFRDLSKQPAINVAEYLLDYKSLEGKFIAVTGQIICATLDTCFIAESTSTIMQNAPFDAAMLPRDDRARLLHCTNILQPCAGTVSGTVVGGFQTKIRADQIGWPPGS